MNVKIDSESIHPMMDYLIVNQSYYQYPKYESSQSIAKTFFATILMIINSFKLDVIYGQTCVPFNLPSFMRKV